MILLHYCPHVLLFQDKEHTLSKYLLNIFIFLVLRYHRTWVSIIYVYLLLNILLLLWKGYNMNSKSCCVIMVISLQCLNRSSYPTWRSLFSAWYRVQKHTDATYIQLVDYLGIWQCFLTDILYDIEESKHFLLCLCW